MAVRWRTRPGRSEVALKEAPAHPAIRQALGALSGWIGWLGASVAGLTALCYGAGYFVLHTHLTMLGLTGAVDIPTDQLLLEGGRFFYFTLAIFIEAAMVIAAIATAIFLLGATAYRMPAIRESRAASSIRRFVANERARRIASFVLPLAIILLVIFHFNSFYDRLTSLRVLNGLAFGPVKAEPRTLAAQVQPLILTGDPSDRDKLVNTYIGLVRNYALFISIVFLVVHKGARTGFGRAANLLLILYAILLTASLPTAFAVLVRSPIYPAAILVFDKAQWSSGLVLQRTDHDVIVWHPQTRHAATYNRDDVSRVTMVGERDIFQKDGRP